MGVAFQIPGAKRLPSEAIPIPASLAKRIPLLERSEPRAKRTMRYKNLEVWQSSVGLSVEIYKHFKASADYGFNLEAAVESQKDAYSVGVHGV